MKSLVRLYGDEGTVNAAVTEFNVRGKEDGAKILNVRRDPLANSHKPVYVARFDSGEQSVAQQTALTPLMR
jgi:hypothetical protein